MTHLNQQLGIRNDERWFGTEADGKHFAVFFNVIEIQEMQSIVFPGFKKVSKKWKTFGNIVRDVEFLKVCEATRPAPVEEQVKVS